MTTALGVYPWKCTCLLCNHLGNTWKPLVLITRHFDYCPGASEGDNQSVRSSAPVVSRCFPGGYNVKLYISRGRFNLVSMAVTGFFVRGRLSILDIDVLLSLMENKFLECISRFCFNLREA